MSKPPPPKIVEPPIIIWSYHFQPLSLIILTPPSVYLGTRGYYVTPVYVTLRYRPAVYYEWRVPAIKYPASHCTVKYHQQIKKSTYRCGKYTEKFLKPCHKPFCWEGIDLMFLDTCIHTYILAIVPRIELLSNSHGVCSGKLTKVMTLDHLFYLDFLGFCKTNHFGLSGFSFWTNLVLDHVVVIITQ